MRRARAVGPFPLRGRGRLRPSGRAGGFRGRLRLQVPLRRAPRGPPGFRPPPPPGRRAGRCAERRGRSRFAPQAGYPAFRPEPALSSLPGHLATGRPPQRENRMKLVRSIALLLACTALPALAQDTRAIRVLVGFPPGGSTDVVTRILTDKLRESLGRPIIVENRPGNGGQVAAIQLKNAAPDGTTLMLTIDHTHVTIPLTFKEPGYDPLKDFTPIVGVAQYYNAMAASAKTGVRSLKEVAAWMKAHPSEHNFGIPAAGSIPQFAGLIVAQSLGVTMEPIPYKGGAPLVQDLIAGQVPIGFGSLTELIEHHRAGRLHVLAVSGTQRAKAPPEIPTLQELGLKGVDKNPRLAFFGPAGMPSTVVININAAVRAAMNAPEVRERFATLGVEPSPTTPVELRQWVQDALAHWGPVIRESGYVLQ